MGNEEFLKFASFKNSMFILYRSSQEAIPFAFNNVPQFSQRRRK